MPPTTYSDSESSDESLSQAGPEDGFSDYSDTYIGSITAPLDGHPTKPSVNFFNKAKYFHISGGTFIGHLDVHYHNGKTGLQRLADAIQDGQDAIHDAHHPEERGCLPTTRESILKTMTDWIFDSPPGILWLSGPAGVGKTAIARTYCKQLQHMGIIVGGDFFFSRNRPHKAKLLFPTLAYELAIRVPCIGNMIGEKVAKEPLITSKEMDIQVSELILAPLQRFLRPQDWPIVFIIDGLDECETDQVQCKIIDVIQLAIRLHPHLPLRFVITSRPEKWIKDKFPSTSHSGFRNIPLEETDETKEDIRKYLALGFKRICKKREDVMREVPKPWPSAEDMDRLVDKASGQFIYASTVLKHVDDDESMPVERLQYILSINAHHSVFGLYSKIIERVKNIEKTRDILAGLLLVSSDAYKDEILSILEALFDLPSGGAYSALNHLHSVLDIRKNREGSDINTQYAVHIHHKTFSDFLTHSNGFFIDTPAYHARLAIGCTRILMGLKAPAGRPSYIAWDYATMRLGYHCQQSGDSASPDLIKALQQLDVSTSLLPILLKTEGRTLQEAEPKIRKKLAGRSKSLSLPGRPRSASIKNHTPTDEAITAAMHYLSTNNLTCSFSIVHEGLLDLKDWLEEINCKSLSRLLQDIRTVITEIRNAQIYRPPRRQSRH